MKNLKPEPLKIKSANPTEQGQRILANIIARSYLHTFRGKGYAGSQLDCKTNDKLVQK